jgi:UDP-glucose 4-epimerase
MKILVTGAAGFIGSHVADTLLAAGHEIVAIDNLSTGRRENLDPRVRLHVVDLSDPELPHLVRRERPDVIAHHAAQIDVRKSMADPLEDIRTNVTGTVRLALAGIEAGTRRFLFASTGGAIYGEQQTHPAAETHPTEPCSPYGCSKLAAEKYLRSIGPPAGLDVVCLRYANVYGPRQSPHGEAGVVAIFARRLIDGQSITINGDGLQTRDFVFVTDVAEANRLALTAPPDVYNVGTGVETTVLEIVRILGHAAGREDGACHGPAKPGEQRRSSIDSSRARSVLGWEPRIALDEGLERTLDFFHKVGR